MKNESSQSLPFVDRREWDFSGIPEDEIEFAVNYEYCRECQYLKDCREHFENWYPRETENGMIIKGSGKRNRGGMISKKPQLEKEQSELQGIRYLSRIDLLATQESKLLDYPWKELKELTEEIKEEIIIPSVPIRFLELWYVKKLIEDEFKNNPGETPNESTDPDKEFEEQFNYLNYGTLSPAAFKCKVVTAYYDIFPLEIRKGGFSKKEIKDAFNKFLDDWYDENYEVKDRGSGHAVKKEFEDRLHDLAVVRLRNKFRPKEIADFTKFFPLELKKAWGSEAKRRNARKRAEQYYQKLFGGLSQRGTMLSSTAYHGSVREGINKFNLGLE